MIDVNINIITRTIPATPRSKNYPQGYSVKSNKTYIATQVISGTTRSKSRALYQTDILQFIKNNRENVIKALLDENGIMSVKGTIRATGDIISNQIFE